MKLLSTLILMLAMALPSWAAQTWPAMTNSPDQTFFGSNQFLKPITGTDSTFSGQLVLSGPSGIAMDGTNGSVNFYTADRSQWADVVGSGLISEYGGGGGFMGSQDGLTISSGQTMAQQIAAAQNATTLAIQAAG